MEGFHQLGSISMINNTTKKNCRKNKNCRKITTIYFGYTLCQWECQKEKKKVLISKLHLSILVYRPETRHVKNTRHITTMEWK